MVIQDAVNTEHPRQYSERQGNTKIQFSKTKRPMKIFYFSSQHICLGWKIAKTVWYNFVEDDENFTHFRVPAARSHFNFSQSKYFALAQNAWIKSQNVTSVWWARHSPQIWMWNMKWYFARHFSQFIESFRYCLSLSFARALSSQTASKSVYVVYAIFRTLAHKHPLEIVHTTPPHIHSARSLTW